MESRNLTLVILSGEPHWDEAQMASLAAIFIDLGKIVAPFKRCVCFYQLSPFSHYSVTPAECGSRCYKRACGFYPAWGMMSEGAWDAMCEGLGQRASVAIYMRCSLFCMGNGCHHRDAVKNHNVYKDTLNSRILHLLGSYIAQAISVLALAFLKWILSAGKLVL